MKNSESPVQAINEQKEADAVSVRKSGIDPEEAVMKPERQKRRGEQVIVTRQICSTSRHVFPPVFEIEVAGQSVGHITEESAIYIHQELGKLLYPEEGGAS
jgi:hypothetical protein